MEGSEYDDYERVEFVEVDEGERVNCVICWFLFSPKQDIKRYNIFHIRCLINNNLCEVIIDNGCSENIVSKACIEVLKLKTESFLSLYHIGLIKKRDIEVNRICRISFWLENHTRMKLYAILMWIHVIYCWEDHGIWCECNPQNRENIYLFYWREKNIFFNSFTCKRCTQCLKLEGKPLQFLGHHSL